MTGQGQASSLGVAGTLDGSIRKPMETTFDEELLEFSNAQASEESQVSSRGHETSPPRSSQKIFVCVRKKPIDDVADVIRVHGKSLMVQNSRLSYCLQDVQVSHKFSFDFVFDKGIPNSQIFDASIRRLVDHSLGRGCSSIIAYGQTGTGKTHTVLEPYTGVVFEAIKHALQSGRQGNISFCEIYMGQVYDCLSTRTRINLFEQGGFMYASEIHQKPFRCFEDVEMIFGEGLLNRTTSATDSNNYSSRSHAVIFIEFTDPLEQPETTRSKQLASTSSLVFVDLAGSERGSDRKTCSKTSAAEGAEINKSLLALKECVRGIELGNKFLPFRQSKLTQILKNSLVGKSMTCIIATVSANQRDTDHTLNTLRYAYRIKESNSTLCEQKQAPTKDSPTSLIDCKENSIPQDVCRGSGTLKSNFAIKKQNPDAHCIPITDLKTQGKVAEDAKETVQLSSMEAISSALSNNRCVDRIASAALGNDAHNSLSLDHSDIIGANAPKSEKNLQRSLEANNVTSSYIFDHFISDHPSIGSSTVKLQKIKINETVDDIIASIKDHSNLQTLKRVFLDLKSISESLKKN